jgi:hypothetical protein
MVSRSLYVGFHVARNLVISLFFVASRICVCTVLFFSVFFSLGRGEGAVALSNDLGTQLSLVHYCTTTQI